jgi:hypothetical protein
VQVVAGRGVSNRSRRSRSRRRSCGAASSRSSQGSGSGLTLGAMRGWGYRGGTARRSLRQSASLGVCVSIDHAGRLSAVVDGNVLASGARASSSGPDLDEPASASRTWCTPASTSASGCTARRTRAVASTSNMSSVGVALGAAQQACVLLLLCCACIGRGGESLVIRKRWVVPLACREIQWIWVTVAVTSILCSMRERSMTARPQ